MTYKFSAVDVLQQVTSLGGQISRIYFDRIEHDVFVLQDYIEMPKLLKVWANHMAQSSYPLGLKHKCKVYIIEEILRAK